MKIIDSQWNKEERLLIGRLSGPVEKADVVAWEEKLNRTLNEIEHNSRFKMLVNLHGFKAANVEAHKRFRGIIPTLLGNYGFRAGYLGLFPEVDLQLQNLKGIQCIAAAHVHQDETKIHLYEEQFSRPIEHFFTDPEKAEKWIRSVPV